jgi:hypothetical protein
MKRCEDGQYLENPGLTIQKMAIKINPELPGWINYYSR